MSFEPFEKNTAEILKLTCIESFSHKHLFTFFSEITLFKVYFQNLHTLVHAISAITFFFLVIFVI